MAEYGKRRESQFCILTKAKLCIKCWVGNWVWPGGTGEVRLGQIFQEGEGVINVAGWMETGNQVSQKFHGSIQGRMEGWWKKLPRRAGMNCAFLGSWVGGGQFRGSFSRWGWRGWQGNLGSEGGCKYHTSSDNKEKWGKKKKVILRHSGDNLKRIKFLERAIR